ncbi:MAG: formyl transferase [Chitinophagaceae bacterium]|nr:formyl transferase [Chitinophagaceae bacterium]
MNKKIVLLCTECYSTTALYNYINKDYPIEAIITENPLRGMALAKRRFKRLGFFRVCGQIVFSLLIVPVLSLFGKKRVNEIKQSYSFDESGLPTEKITHFATVNDEACISLLEKINPDIVLVNGTRIISKKILERCKAVFMNMHAGITPQYRGVHGGYWAVANNDLENCGVTIHLVDKGIDTGGILYQNKITVTRKDNFTTYPFSQLGEGMPLVKKAISDAVLGQLKPLPHPSSSGKLWYHPTIWQYLYYRLFRNTK